MYAWIFMALKFERSKGGAPKWSGNWKRNIDCLYRLNVVFFSKWQVRIWNKSNWHFFRTSLTEIVLNNNACYINHLSLAVYIYSLSTNPWRPILKKISRNLVVSTYILTDHWCWILKTISFCYIYPFTCMKEIKL